MQICWGHLRSNEGGCQATNAELGVGKAWVSGTEGHLHESSLCSVSMVWILFQQVSPIWWKEPMCYGLWSLNGLAALILLEGICKGRCLAPYRWQVFCYLLDHTWAQWPILHFTMTEFPWKISTSEPPSQSTNIAYAGKRKVTILHEQKLWKVQLSFNPVFCTSVLELVINSFPWIWRSNILFL